MVSLTGAIGLPRSPKAVPYGIASLVNSVGTGMFFPFSVLFFHHKLDLPIAQVGLGLSIAAGIAILAVALVGRTVDLVGGRWVLIASLVLRGTSCVLFLTISSYGLFLVLAVVDAVTMRVGQLSDQAVVAEISTEPERPRWLALSRTAFNGGLGAGALLGGGIISAGASGVDYTPLVLANAASFFLAAVLFLFLRTENTRPVREHQVAKTAAWRDRLFVSVCVINGGLWLAAMAIEIALPVYLVKYLAAPGWAVSLVFTINTVLVLLLQLPSTRWTARRSASTVIVTGTACYTVAFLILVPAGGLGLGALVALLVLTVAIFTVGEVLVSVAAIDLVLSLAPAATRGSYLSVSHVFLGAGSALAPGVLIGVLSLGTRVLWISLVAATAVMLVASILLRGAIVARLPGEREGVPCPK